MENFEGRSTVKLYALYCEDRYPWGSEKLERVKKVTENFIGAFTDVFALGFVRQYLPLFLVEIIWKTRVQACRTKSEALKALILEQLEEHQRTFDKNNIRDFIDIYLSEERHKTWTKTRLVNNICLFFPDACSTTCDAINWSFIYLAYHPEDQQAAQKQLHEVSSKGFKSKSYITFFQANITGKSKCGLSCEHPQANNLQ